MTAAIISLSHYLNTNAYNKNLQTMPLFSFSKRENLRLAYFLT